MDRLPGEETSGRQMEAPQPHPASAPSWALARSLPTSLEVMFSRSLVSNTFHSSARIACSICSCSEGLRAEPISPGPIPYSTVATPSFLPSRH